MLAKLFRNMNIGKKYGLALGGVIFLFCISAVIVYIQLSDVKKAVAALQQKGNRSIEITKMASLFQEQDIRIADYINHSDDRFVREFEERKADFHTLEKRLQATMQTDKEAELFEQIKKNNQEMTTLFYDKMISAVQRGDQLDILLARQRAQALRSETVGKLEELESTIHKQREEASAEAANSLNKSILVLVASILLSIIAGLTAVYMINRLVRSRLNRVIEMAASISEGDLTIEKSTYEGRDEIAGLSCAMNKMLESLQEMIRKMTAVSEHVSGQSEELTKTSSEVGEGSRQAAAAMQQISHGAGVQADETNELSTSMVSYAEKIREANSNGKCIEDASKAVLQLTSEGSCLMTASVSQMNKIDVIMQNAVRKVKGLDGQTKEISVLVAVIQGIAEQTNLLALNAAIEAARAGEQGKGFAVVADEVRKLAVQAAVSVGDITDIVTSIQEESAEVAASLETGYTEVGNGIEKIQDTGETFAKIEASVSDMAIRIQTVSESLGDIAADSEQMNGVIESIASIAEESAAGIEQASASILQTGSSMEGVAGKARELSVLAEDLNSLIRKFVV